MRLPAIDSTVASDRSKLRVGREGITTLRNHPERDPNLALSALQRGLGLGRTMTLMERLSLAVTSTQPTHHLTLTVWGAFIRSGMVYAATAYSWMRPPSSSQLLPDSQPTPATRVITPLLTTTSTRFPKYSAS